MRPVLLLATGMLAAGSLAACGSSPSANTAAGGAPSAGSSQQGYGAGGSAGTGQAERFPGASGTIADITGTTLQVQNQTDGQVAVTYSGTTTFTAQVPAKLSDVKVGSCVTVTPAASSTSSGSAPADAVTAGTVRISPPQNGSCTGALGFGRGGDRPSGQGFSAPSGRPTSLPSGAPGVVARGGFFGDANGTVASVTPTGFTVTEQRPDFSAGQPSAGASPSMTTSTVTVTVDGSTTYSTSKAATASALAVGKCVTAMGQADTTGAIAATRIAVSDPENGQCGGFGFVRGAGPGGPDGRGGPGAAGDAQGGAGNAAPGGAA